jgi:hypothetical protein
MMNLLGAWKKLVIFGMLGAAGCLIGSAVGEVYLQAAQAVAASTGVDQGPSLISSQATDTAEPPPPPNEFKERLEKAGAHTGDIQISLIWFNTNDLDLHCIDPQRHEISWQARRSPSGGELDVDRNAGCRSTTVEPVENIYWPKGGAPMGHYQVFVDYFQRCSGAPNETRYQVTVLHGGERKEFTNVIARDETHVTRQMVYEFELAPRIEVVAPPEFQLHCGAAVRVPVAVRRSFYSGKLDLKAENLPEGVTAKAGSIEAGKNEGEIELKASRTAAAGKTMPIKLAATAAEVSGSAEARLEVLEPPFSWIAAIVIGVWTALLALGLCLALVVGQNRYLGRPTFASGRIPLAIVVLGAALAGFISGAFGQSLYSLLLTIGAGSVGFLLGWVLLGGLLGVGVSCFVPNLDRKKALVAGLAGGLLGAIGYLVWSNAAEWLGRVAGAALLGFCIGLMVAIVEAAFRRVWLEVRYGERETIVVNLGPEPVKIGGDARACTIWARGAVAMALRYFVRNGAVICEDAPSRSETVVGNGDTRTIGAVTLTVRTGAGLPASPRPAPKLAELAPPPLSAPLAPAEPVQRPAPVARPAPAPPTPAPAAAPKPAVPAPAATAPPKPAAVSAPTAPPKPPVPSMRPPVPASIKPPAPVAPPKPAAATPKPPAPTAAPAASEAAARKTADPDACPSCGRKAPGRPGARFCMLCDKAY